MTPATYQKVRLGTCVCYLLPADGGWVLIDAGNRGREKTFARKLSRLGIAPGDIRLIVLTHTHFDHVGSLAAIKQMCGCPVAVHSSEAQRLAQGRADIPPGNRSWSKFLVRHSDMLRPHWPRFQAVEPEVIIDGDMALDRWGLEATVMHTPGHTSGSLSVITPDGHAFVGDLCVYDPPMTGRYVLPPFAEDTPQIPHSWRKVLETGVKAVHPAHIRSFKAQIMAREAAMRLGGGV